MTLNDQITSLQRRIARARTNHIRYRHLEDRLVAARLRQLRAELRAGRLQKIEQA